MIDGQNLCDQPVKNYLREYDDIRKITTGKRHDYTTDYTYFKMSLLDYIYFKKYYNLIAIDSNEHWALATFQIDFTLNLIEMEVKHYF